MHYRLPDPEYAVSARSRANFVLAVKLSFGLLLVVWAVFLFEQVSGLNLIQYGLRPREPAGLLGLITTPLLHFNLAHITSNSLPLMVGGTLMLFLYPNSALRALPLLFVGTGALAWLFARSSIHIGASGLIYGLLAFVFASGVLRRDLRSIGAALAVWFMYGSMLWGILPAGRSTSWELHLSGLVLGVALAWWFRRWDQPPLKRYDWEDEDEPEDDRSDHDPMRVDQAGDGRTAHHGVIDSNLAYRRLWPRGARAGSAVGRERGHADRADHEPKLGQRECGCRVHWPGRAGGVAE